MMRHLNYNGGEQQFVRAFFVILANACQRWWFNLYSQSFFRLLGGVWLFGH
jgi:hypothetical protein